MDGLPITEALLTPWSLVGLFFLLVMTGRLVPWWAQKREQEHADKWQEAFMDEAKANRELTRQLDQLIRALPLPNPTTGPPRGGRKTS